MNRIPLFLGFLLLLAIPSASWRTADRVLLFPKLYVGQILRYQVGFRSTTKTDTESSVAAPMAPSGGQTNANLFLQVEVEDLRNDAGDNMARLRVQIVEPDAVSAKSGAPRNTEQNASGAVASGKPGKSIEFTLRTGGLVTDIEGVDKLSSDERAAWQEWVDRFGGAAALPEKGVKLGEKWKTDEPIPNALLAGLSWEKESEYVNDAPCFAIKLTAAGDPAAGPQSEETCAVILTTAILKQKSSPKNATPEDYKLHDLRNTGTASGKNQVISYFSLKTGLVVRATEDANQSMSVTVATADGSNRVHYTITAESHARVLLLADPPANHP
ncbi:MAG TPA: hypothetical protein VMI32_23085 [Candidatus Solibacter sp.]|nr:hypothetical protein [Candidatus Solibacter sp.]